jgi:hypothetical protein
VVPDVPRSEGVHVPSTATLADPCRATPAVPWRAWDVPWRAIVQYPSRVLALALAVFGTWKAAADSSSLR